MKDSPLPIDKISALRLVTQDNRLAIVLLIALSDGGIPFGKLRRELNLESNSLCYHIQKLMKAAIVNKKQIPMTASVLEGDRASVGAEKSESLSTARTSNYHLTRKGKSFLSQLGLDSVQDFRELLDAIKSKPRSFVY